MPPSGLHLVGKGLLRVDVVRTSFNFPRGVELKIISRELTTREDSKKRYVLRHIIWSVEKPK